MRGFHALVVIASISLLSMTICLAARIPLTGVQLAPVASSPQPVNTAITLLANPIGGTNIEYRYFVSSGNEWVTLQAYSTSVTCSWTPTAEGDYSLLVMAREIGSPNQYDAYASIPYSIRQPLSAVKLYVTPSANAVNRPVTLMAEPVGGAQVEYQFFIFEDETYRIIRPYDRNPVCVWTPSTPGTYKLLVWAREMGDPSHWQEFCKIIGYTVQPTLSNVTLFAGGSAPYMMNLPITLCAVPAGGGQVRYRFFVSINDGAITQLRPYELPNHLIYRPTSPGKYTFLVWAREEGNTCTQDAYSTVTVAVAAPPPITQVQLTTTPLSPQPTGATIKLNATPTGGALVEYRYLVSINNGGFIQLRPYNTDPQYSYTLPTAGNYTFLVHDRFDLVKQTFLV